MLTPLLSRRAAGLGLAALPLTGCAAPSGYDQAVLDTWRLAPAGPGDLPVPALVHAACLAANSHNTQPWRFEAEGRRIAVRPDFARRTPVVDPDDHHLYVSIGCAAETMLQAAPGYGWSGEVDGVGREGVALSFMPSEPRRTAAFEAIPRRASTRAEYDGRPVPPGVLLGLVAAAGPQVEAIVLQDSRRLEDATGFILEGNAAQVADRAFRRELKRWIRFSEPEAAATRDGLFAGASGNPALPRAIGEPLFELAFTESGEADKIRRQMNSSAGLVVFTAPSNDVAGWVEAGRAYTRFALAATAEGLKLAFLNQAVEHAPTRAEFARWLGAPDARPDLVIRFGYGPDMPRSLRRPARQVLDHGGGVSSAAASPPARR